VSHLRSEDASWVTWRAFSPNRLEREFFIDNLLVRIHFIIVVIRWTGLAPRGFGFPFPGSLTSTFLAFSSAAAKQVGCQPTLFFFFITLKPRDE